MWSLALASLGFACGEPSARSLPKLCAECLPEPLETDYFGGAPGGEPPRLRWPVSADAFREAARSGKVLILENASAGALKGWSCEKLAQEFPEAKMRREYDWVKNPEDRNLQTMGTASWAETTIAGEDASERLAQDENAPPFAPFYWGVREHYKGDLGSQKVVRRVRELITQSVPEFMDDRNGASLFDNAEFWLGAKGTGARAHMDSHCISTLSVVLHGARRWRIGPVPRLPKGAGRSGDDEVVFDDGVAYKLGWKPMFEFTVREGEAVLFPPGWIHETLNTAEGCTVALTTQFDFPQPVRYFRSYYNRLRRVGDLNACWRQMMSWPGKLPKDPHAVSKTAEQIFEKRAGTWTAEELDFYDLDEDGAVAKAEFLDTFAAWAATERAIRKEKKRRMPKCDVRWDDKGMPDEL
ncbi:unnamed protein product [Effrenium voratum]|nr:unnamed protein product [Effrenium voratum]